jgi:hypothetical protein
LLIKAGIEVVPTISRLWSGTNGSTWRWRDEYFLHGFDNATIRWGHHPQP